MGTEEQSDPTQPETNDPNSGSSRWNPRANSDQAESQTDYACKQHKSFFGKSAELLKEPKTWLEIAALVVVILYTGYARKQSMAMNETLDEIRKQTNYAKSSSMAATDAAKDATASVKVARETLKAGNESFDKTMAEMKAQTGAIQVTAQSENRSAAVSAEILTTTIRSFRDEQRPWVGMGEIQSQIDAKEPFKLNIPFVNSGKTPAIHTEVAVSYNIYYAYQSGPPPNPAYDFIPTASIPPQGKYVLNVTNGLIPDFYERIMAKKALLVFFGAFRYHDAYGSTLHTTNFCLMFDPNTKQMNFCMNGNDMN